jgi:hypothetical protein
MRRPQADGHRDRRRRPAFDSEDHNPQPLGAIGVLLNALQTLQFAVRQMILHVHRNLP